MATETKDGGNVSSPRGEGEGGEAGGSDAPEVPEGDAQGGVGVPEGGGGGSASEEGKDVAGVAGENGNATPGEKGIEVAVKIQRVPEDEVGHNWLIVVGLLLLAKCCNRCGKYCRATLLEYIAVIL